MVVEGSRRSRLAADRQEGLPSPDQIQKNSEDDPFLSQCLVRLGIGENGHINGVSEVNAEMLDETTKSHVLQDPFTRSERDFLTLIVLAKMLRDDTATKSAVGAFLIHCILMKEIQISKRRCDLSQHADANASIVSFTSRLAAYAESVLESRIWKQAMSRTPIECDLVDFVDGRLLQLVFTYQQSITETMMAIPRLKAKLSDSCKLVQALSDVELDAAQSSGSIAAEGKRPTPEHSSSQKSTILPFSSPIFDKHLASIQISVARDPALRPESARIFQEVTHWHSVKRRLDPKAAQTLSAKERFWALKRNQYFMAEMLSYAASLTNASGKALDPETITVSDGKKFGQKTLEADKDKENLPITKVSKPQGGKGAPKGKAVGSKAIRDEIAATRAAKEEDSVEKVFKAWETARKFFDSDALPRSRFLKAKAYLISLPPNKQKQVEAEVEFYKLCALFEVYRSSDGTRDTDKQSTNDNRLGVAAMLWDSLRKLSSLKNLTKAMVDNGQQIATALGLPAIDFSTSEFHSPIVLYAKPARFKCAQNALRPPSERLPAAALWPIPGS